MNSTPINGHTAEFEKKKAKVEDDGEGSELSQTSDIEPMELGSEEEEK